jgi:hypothetical protein
MAIFSAIERLACPFFSVVLDKGPSSFQALPVVAAERRKEMAGCGQDRDEKRTHRFDYGLALSRQCSSGAWDAGRGFTKELIGNDRDSEKRPL